jgi:transcriptional regulator with XRE-family HTH domain
MNKKLFEEYGKQFEIAYTINALRKQKKISQATLAKKIGTTQSNIARIEAGNQNLTTSMLLKIARAFDKDLQIRFV